MKTPLNLKNTKSDRIVGNTSPTGPALVSTLIIFLAILIMTPFPTFGKETPSVSNSQVITYPLSQFADGKAKFFQFKTPDGKTIRYFIVKSSDGIIRAAFDACDVCWPSGKGYYQDGGVMVCKNCGQRFPTSKVNIITGGCNPTALNRQFNKTLVTIQVRDIVTGRHYFNF